MHPQIWIPKPDTPIDPVKLLESVGLEDWTHGFDFADLRGPDERPGRMFGWLNPRDNRVIRPAEQLEWMPAIAIDSFASERYWIGFHPDPPTPRDLAHKHQFPGVAVKLGDSNHWMIPQPSQLPKTLVYGDNEIVLQASFRANGHKIKTSFLKQTQRFEEFLREADPEDQLDWFSLAEYCRESIAVNYRICPEILNRLQLLDQVTARAILYVCLSILRNE